MIEELAERENRLCCIGCGAEGSATMQGRDPVQSGIGFYLRVPRNGRGSTEIVCDRCGSTHRNHIP